MGPEGLLSLARRGAHSTNAAADKHTCRCTRPTASFKETDQRDYRSVVYQMTDTPGGQNAPFRGFGYNGQVPLNFSGTRDATSQNDQTKAFPHCEVSETLAKSPSRSVSLARPSSLLCPSTGLQLTWKPDAAGRCERRRQVPVLPVLWLRKPVWQRNEAHAVLL